LAFEIWKLSNLCSASKVGNSYPTPPLYSPESSKLNISLDGTSWMQPSVIIQAILGGAYGVLNPYLLWAIDRRLEMVIRLMFGVCHGSATFPLSNHPLHRRYTKKIVR